MLDLQNGIDTSRKNRRGWEGAAPASDAVARASVPRLIFFFFFFSSDSGRIGFNSCRIRLIRPESGRIGHIKSYWPATDTAETGRKRPKSALKLAGNRQNSDLKGVSCLPLSLFCESRYSNVFFKNILIENINKNIFNNFLIAESHRTRTLLFQKLPSPAPTPAPKSRNAPVLHRDT